jgi:hypothetical protein
MNFYRTLLGIDLTGAVDYSHHATLAEAHRAAKAYSDRPNVRVEHIDVDTSKDGVLSLLQGYSATDGAYPVFVLRAWGITPRGGLDEWTEAELRALHPAVKLNAKDPS